jgi:hypothetical protein
MVFSIGLLGATGLTPNLQPSNLARPSTTVPQGPIDVIQLPADKGLIPVEIQEPKISVNAKTGAPELAYIVKNNSDKPIDALAVAITGKAANNGKEFSTTGYMTRDSMIHPDIRAIHHQSSLAPGQEWSFGPEPIEVDEGAVFKGITLRIDFAHFEDQTILGPNQHGTVLMQVRQGALKYKAWLVKKYQENDKLVTALLPLLTSNTLPTEVDLVGRERTGAIFYRSHILKAYNDHGAAVVQQYLSQ